MSLVVAHDYVTQRGGAERVALQMLDGLRPDRLVTSVYNADTTFPGFAHHEVQTSVLQCVAAFRRDPRRAFPLLAPVWSTLEPPSADVLLCSSSGWSHGLSRRAATRKVVYCHNPPRWLWQPDDYKRGLGRAGRTALRLMSRSLKSWDLRQAQTADQYIANSGVVRDRIRDVYGIDAPVVPPPVGLTIDGDVHPIEGAEPGFVLTIARNRGYKRVSAVVEAFRHAPSRRLMVIGDESPGQPAAPPNVTFLGRVSDAQLRWLYTHASALVSASKEDFGLTPIEANQFGTPAVTIRAGGFLETVREGVNGVYFDDLQPRSLLASLDRAERLPRDCVAASSARHQPDVFLRRLSPYL
ncbi:glycosyltransferase [Geodermatophilus sp. SYSU D00742]